MKNHSRNFIKLTFAAAVLALNLFFGQQTKAGSFFAVNPMAATRAAHTATLLPGGKVLVAGGLSDSGFLSSAELYDPAAQTWSPTGALNITRDGHTATLLADGKVLIVGGHTIHDLRGPLSSAEIYDPAAGEWRLTGGLKTGRRFHTATLLQNGMVLVVGGYDGNKYLNSVELYDPATGKWTETSRLSTARRSHTATLLPDGKVLVAGGLSRDGHLSSTEIYDPTTGTWLASGALNNARKYHTATLLANGKVLVAGGQGVVKAGYIDFLTSAEIFDPATGMWTATGTMSAARQGHTATLLPDGKLLVAGGYDGHYLSSAEIFDPSSGSWTVTAGLNEARVLHTGTLLPNGRVLITGGNNDSTSLNLTSTEVFDGSR